MQSTWLPLDPGEWNKPRRETIQGVTVDLYLSPQDVPDAVRGFYDEGIGRFAIEFRYPTGEEPKAEVDFGQHVALTVGKNSDRLYRVTIDVDKLQAKAVGLQMYVQSAFKDVRTAINSLAADRKRVLREGNYRLAGQVIDRHSRDLLQSVPG